MRLPCGGSRRGGSCLRAHTERAKSTESNKFVEALEGLRFKDGDRSVSFRDWDHQLIRRPVVGTAQPNPSSNWDTLKVKPLPATSTAELERLFGSKEEI